MTVIMIKLTFTFELDSMERMLIQTELIAMAGDHESYKISTIENTLIRALICANANGLEKVCDCILA